MGFEPIVRPLLRIETLSPPLPAAAPDALVFTSRNGVAVWAGLDPRRDIPVLAVGQATAQAARAVGFLAVRAAGGDVATLAALIRSDTGLTGARLLHPGAEIPAGDLGGLVAPHARIETLSVYRAVETGDAPPEGFDAILIHSPRAGRALAETAARGSLAGRIACAISANAAAPLQGLGLAETRTARTPDETALLACLGKPPAAV